MSTIAFKDGIIASDSLFSDGMMKHGSIMKIAKHEAGFLAGAAGSVAASQLFLKEFMAAPNPLIDGDYPAGDGADLMGMMITRSGVIWLYDEGVIYDIMESYYAIGSGSPHALTAMDAGASAEDAVKAAIARDPFSAGPINCLTLKK